MLGENNPYKAPSSDVTIPELLGKVEKAEEVESGFWRPYIVKVFLFVGLVTLLTFGITYAIRMFAS